MKWILALTLLLPSLAMTAQSKLTVNVKIVAVTAVVRDKDGRLLPKLTKDDFVLREDDKLQPIHYFSEDAYLPLQLGLLIDTSGSEWSYRDEERRASEAFLSSMLTHQEDQAFLVQFDTNVLLLQSMTSDFQKLEAGLRRLNQPHEARPNGGGTLLFDAVIGTMQNITKNMTGRRAIIILSDGMDVGSNGHLNDAVAWAQLADTTIYTVLYGDARPGVHLGNQASLHSGVGVLQFLAHSTGGHFFCVSKQQSIADIYREIQQELRSQYRIGYVPPSPEPMKYHHIELTTKVKGATVQARTGYIILKP